MSAQTYSGAVRWVVVDDGEEAQPMTFHREGWEVVMIRPTPFWQPGQNTQARNLLAGLDAIGSDERLVIIEDDDWYAPDWLSTVSAKLEQSELVGESQARYYNIALRRGRQLSNNAHASLCSTAMRGDALSVFRSVCYRSQKFIDLDLWRRARSRHLFGGHRVVGIKGLPGRGGIGMGHRDDFSGKDDADGSLLRAWVGDDAGMYA